MNIGQRYLITTDNWFIASDGQTYRAAFGTVHGVVDSQEALGVRTNAKSTNWYVVIGDMVIAGCQIHYAICTNAVSFDPPVAEIDHEGKRFIAPSGMTRIYNADESGIAAFMGQRPVAGRA